MDLNIIIKKAKRRHDARVKIKEKKNIKNALAWLDFSGLLRNQNNNSSNRKIHLKDLLELAKVEGRVYELLPLIMSELSFAIDFEYKDIPSDLLKVLEAIKNKENYPNYHFVKPEGYLQWFGSPVHKFAKKKLRAQARPRNKNNVNDLAKIIKEGRINLGFTQEHFAKRFGVSLRVLRDLEQGKENIGFDRLKKIIFALDKKIEILS